MEVAKTFVVRDLDASGTFLKQKRIQGNKTETTLPETTVAVFTPTRKPDHLPFSSIFRGRTVSFREGHHPLVAHLMEDIPIGKKRELEPIEVELANYSSHFNCGANNQKRIPNTWPPYHDPQPTLQPSGLMGSLQWRAIRFRIVLQLWPYRVATMEMSLRFPIGESEHSKITLPRSWTDIAREKWPFHPIGSRIVFQASFFRAYVQLWGGILFGGVKTVKQQGEEKGFVLGEWEQKTRWKDQ